MITDNKLGDTVHPGYSHVGVQSGFDAICNRRTGLTPIC